MLPFPMHAQSPHFQPSCPDHNNDPDRSCTCMRDAERQERKDKRDRAVVAVTRALKKHGVAYRPSGTAHVVVVTQPGFAELYLSLKSKLDGRNMTVYKYRFAHSTEWLTKRRDDFFTWLMSPATQKARKALVPVDIMPIGKYRGRTIAELAVEKPSYLTWMYKADFIHDDLRRTLALFIKA